MGSDKKYIVILHIVLAVYSFLGIFSKLAASEKFFSYKFVFYYTLVLMGLVLYAFIWQQMLKHLPLVTAYANRAVGVIWGIIWGYVFFGEDISARKVLGAAIIIAGVYMVVSSDYTECEKGKPV